MLVGWGGAHRGVLRVGGFRWYSYSSSPRFQIIPEERVLTSKILAGSIESTKSGFGGGYDTWRFCDAGRYHYSHRFRHWHVTTGVRVNWHLFAGFLVITIVLILTPGPIVTPRDLDGCDKRCARRAFSQFAGTSTGNALLLASIALGLKLGVEPCRLSIRAAAMDRCCVSHLARRCKPGAMRGRSALIPSGKHVHFLAGLFWSL